MGARKHIDEDDVDPLTKAVERIAVRVLKEQLPELLRTGDIRRPPQQVTPQPESLKGETYLKKQEVVALTGYSARTIARLVASGKLRPCGVGRDRFARSEVDRMMNGGQADDPGAADDPDADVTAAVDRLFPRK